MADKLINDVTDRAPSADALADQFVVERQEGAAACHILLGKGLPPLAPCIVNPVGSREGLKSKNVRGASRHGSNHARGLPPCVDAENAP